MSKINRTITIDETVWFQLKSRVGNCSSWIEKAAQEYIKLEDPAKNLGALNDELKATKSKLALLIAKQQESELELDKKNINPLVRELWGLPPDDSNEQPTEQK